jgi:UDP-N-acetylglucosamine diphosphorylase/glucosamine-1-phosphate N-acetyltransferase
VISPEADSPSRSLAAIVLAAGQGKRMQDPSLAKVLYPIGGEPMLGHVLRLCKQIEAAPIICIIGYGREAVTAYISEKFPDVRTAIQEEQLGTGHAVQQAERQLNEFTGDVLVLSGDVPLLTKATTKKLLEEHRARNSCATVLAVQMKNPTGYGRIVRTPSGSLEKIVEEKDATPKEKKITEINSGIYVFDAKILFEVLKRIDRTNAQGEFYLTDTFALLIAQFGLGAVSVVTTNDPIEVSGVNTKDQLAALDAEYNRRK